MNVRPAENRDAVACAAILREWIDETDWFPSLHPPSADAGFVARQFSLGQSLVAGAPVTGFLARDGAYIRCLYVRREARERGVGRALLERAKAEVERLSLWTFEANARARAFYLREGFCEGQRTDGDNEEGLPDIEFVWQRKGVEA